MQYRRLTKKGPPPERKQPQHPPPKEAGMAQSPPAPENAFVPVRVSRKLFESYDPAIRAFIERRVQHGEAVIGDD